MKLCSRCGWELTDEADVCPNCAVICPNSFFFDANIGNNDQISVVLCILSALFPLFGAIYWPIKHKKTPERARACGLTAIVAWAVFIVLALLVWE